MSQIEYKMSVSLYMLEIFPSETIIRSNYHILYSLSRITLRREVRRLDKLFEGIICKRFLNLFLIGTIDTLCVAIRFIALSHRLLGIRCIYE